ncbi:Bgt-20121, partial [Blumeria graminis f. sp. tritici]
QSGAPLVSAEFSRVTVRGSIWVNDVGALAGDTSLGHVPEMSGTAGPGILRGLPGPRRVLVAP